MSKHYDLGVAGEKLAQDYLVKKNYEILETNFRYLKAEVDIIAQKGTSLVAVEVKTRTTAYFGNPQDFISTKKIRLLVSAMDYYVLKKALDVEVRFDIIAIIKKNNAFQIEHLKDAFLYF